MVEEPYLVRARCQPRRVRPSSGTDRSRVYRCCKLARQLSKQHLHRNQRLAERQVSCPLAALGGPGLAVGSGHEQGTVLSWPLLSLVRSINLALLDASIVTTRRPAPHDPGNNPTPAAMPLLRSPGARRRTKQASRFRTPFHTTSLCPRQ